MGIGSSKSDKQPTKTSTVSPRQESSNRYTSSSNATREQHRVNQLPPKTNKTATQSGKSYKVNGSTKRNNQSSKPIIRKVAKDKQCVTFTGTCNQFDATKGFGFIMMDDGSGKVFVHAKEIIDNQYKTMRKGDELQFEIAVQNTQRKAINVRYLNTGRDTINDYKQQHDFCEDDTGNYCDSYGDDYESKRQINVQKYKQLCDNNTHWNTDDVESAITDAIIDCVFAKCVNTSQCYAQKMYISPQELVQYLPQSLAINRQRHVKKHSNGQWEIQNRNIHCYLGFQVVSRDYDLKRFVKHLHKKKAEKYRNIQQNRAEEKKECGDCKICGRSLLDVHPSFNRHICRVSGYFRCKYYGCNGRSFKVGICLLDPNTETPPTRYKCAKCGYVAPFVRYDLKQNANDNESVRAPHRSDLCEACDIWGDCQQPFAQPSNISESLWDLYEVPSIWTMNQNGDGFVCSFSMPAVLDPTETQCKLEIKPYVNCVKVNSNYKGKRLNRSGSQKYENPPEAPQRKVTVCFRCNEEGHIARKCPLNYDKRTSDRKCYRCGESGHLVRDCDLANNEKCHRCGEIGHWARDCVARNDYDIYNDANANDDYDDYDDGNANDDYDDDGDTYDAYDY